MRALSRGFSLLELVVAVGLGTIVAVAGLTFTRDFHRFHSRHSAELEASQGLRGSVELILADLRNAGVGIGYRPDGRFEGILTGTQDLPGGARFQADDRLLDTVDGRLSVDDLGIRRALGPRRTILHLEDGTGEICGGLAFEPGSLAAVASRTGRVTRTVRLLGTRPSSCQRGTCTGGCASISWTAEGASYVSDPSARTSRFTGGDLFTDFETVVWFVAVDENGRGQLRRAVAEQGCTALDTVCGGEIAPGVVVLQYAIWRYDEEDTTWVRVPHVAPVATLDRLRVDVEVIIRGGSDPGVGKTIPVVSQLREGLCVPTPCGREADGVPRLAVRASVEVRNAGRLRLR